MSGALLLSACAVGDESGTAAVSTSSASPNTSTAAPAKTRTPSQSDADGAYVDRDGFSIKFPPTWETRSDVGGAQVVAFPPDQLAADFADNVNVLFEDLGVPDLTVEEYLDLSEQNAPSFAPEFRLVARNDAGDYGTLEYTGAPQRPLHFLALVKVKNGRAYTATFTATPDTYDAQADAALAIMRTLELTDVTP